MADVPCLDHLWDVRKDPLDVGQVSCNRILSRDQILVSCSHMTCCLQKYTTHQFKYFIYYLFQDKFKYKEMI